MLLSILSTAKILMVFLKKKRRILMVFTFRFDFSKIFNSDFLFVSHSRFINKCENEDIFFIYNKVKQFL